MGGGENVWEERSPEIIYVDEYLTNGKWKKEGKMKYLLMNT